MQSAFVMTCAADKSSGTQNGGTVAVGGLDHMISVYRISDYLDQKEPMNNNNTASDTSKNNNSNNSVVNPINATGSRAASVTSNSGSTSTTRNASTSSNVTAASLLPPNSNASTVESKGRQLSMRIGGRGGYDQANMTLLGHDGFISGLSFLDNGTKVVSSSDDHTAALWDLESGTCIDNFFGHTQGLTAIGMNPENGNVFATSSFDRTLKIWDRRVKTTSPGGAGAATKNNSNGSNSSSPLTIGGGRGGDMSRFYVSNHDYDENNFGCVQTFSKNTSEIDCLSWFPDGHAIATGSKDSTCRVFDLRCCGQVGSYVGSALRSPCKTIEFSKSGRFLWAGYYDSKIRVFDLSLHPQAEPVATLGGHRREVRAIKRSPDGESIVSVGIDSKVLIYA